MKIEITFTEPLLGTLSGNKEIAEEFINSKHPEGHSEEESDLWKQEHRCWRAITGKLPIRLKTKAGIMKKIMPGLHLEP